MPVAIITIFLLVIGLIFGSFLGALTYRLPESLAISKGRSFCPKCKKQIKWFDNIPLLSWIILRGKCRNCKEEISVRYPLIELSTALTFVIIGLHPFYLILSLILIAIFVIDLEHQIIPDGLVFLGLSVSVAYYLLLTTIYASLLAGFISALLLLSLNLITKGKGMGLGDVKLALLLGSLAGLQFFLPWLFFSFTSGALVGIILMIFKKAEMKGKIAFGPFLIIGFVLNLIFGRPFLRLIGIV